MSRKCACNWAEYSAGGKMANRKMNRYAKQAYWPVHQVRRLIKRFYMSANLAKFECYLDLRYLVKIRLH